MKKVVLLLVMILPATAWAGEWTLDGAASDLTVLSMKKEKVAEVHHFSGLSGIIYGNSAKFEVDLATIESGISIRNERMRSMLFEISRFSTATITADLSAINYQLLKVGEMLTTSLPFTLDLHGMKKDFTAQIRVVALAEHKLLITSRRAVIVKAADFQLEDGIEALRQIAKLPSIAQAVPVSFQLQFARRGDVPQ